MREMHTFRKLPITMPKRKKKNGITDLTVPQACERLNAMSSVACRMANGKARRRAASRQTLEVMHEAPPTPQPPAVT